MRVEKDLIGEVSLPSDALYGIHTYRAMNNFIDGKKVNIHLINALVVIKKCAAMTNSELGMLTNQKKDAIISSCDEILVGEHNDSFQTSAYQGGAGTSTNMNVNEVICNLALLKLGYECGDYHELHPLDHINMSQSTNDVYPTAMRIATIKLLRKVANEYAALQESFQEKENEFADILRLGRTQMMDALPMFVGQGFGAYAKAVSRDRWRLYKVEERLREINIGGTAIGTGLNAEMEYIFSMTDNLQEVTGLGISRSDYPMDITQNLDVFVEVSGLLKSAAVSLIKIANDLRILSSGPRGGFGEITLKTLQAGSSIMPGKINPIIPEMTIQIGNKIIANDLLISNLSAAGNLELNSFSPMIIDALLESLELLIKGVHQFRVKCIDSILINEDKCMTNLEASTALAPALVHILGYDRVSYVANMALELNKTIREVVLDQKLLTETELDNLLNPYQITSPGIPGGAKNE